MATHFLPHKPLPTSAGASVWPALPAVMGIINLTPDSFYTGSRQPDASAALAQAEAMLAAGATYLDLGAMSTRPGADDVPPEEELARLLPALRAIRQAFAHALISVDTCRASVAHAALQEGASLINDITAGADPAMLATVAAARVPYILMHTRGTPKTMTQLTVYTDVVAQVLAHLQERVAAAKQAGITAISIDPGFGFAKTAAQSFTMLANLGQFTTLGCPVLVGISRKRMVWQTLGTTADHALNGTTALHMAALLGGASILRVHDVLSAVETVQLYNRLAHPNLYANL